MPEIKLSDLINTELNIPISSLVCDSRKITKGSLFFCIKGERFDSHDIIDEIAAKGVSAVVVEKDVSPLVSVPVIRVENTREALSHAAVKFYGDFDKKMSLIGVTGTNGKTSTTYFIESILNAACIKALRIGTVGIGLCGRKVDIAFAASTTPDTLDLMEILKTFEKDADAVVMEISSHALDQHRVSGLHFKVGIFTNLSQDHLDYHVTMENYFAAKRKLFERCEYAVLNADDKYALGVDVSKCRVISYGLGEADVTARNIVYKADGTEYDAHFFGRSIRISTSMPGRFNVYNSLAAIAAAAAIGVQNECITEGIANCDEIPGRIQRVSNNRGFEVYIDYAHSPESLSEIISAVKNFSKYVITVFGCGGGRDVAKRPIMGEIAGRLSDYCVLTSDNPRMEDPNEILTDIESGIKKTDCPYEIWVDRKSAIRAALKHAKQGDSVIIAGKGHEKTQEIAGIFHEFCDLTVAEEILGEFNHNANY